MTAPDDKLQADLDELAAMVNRFRELMAELGGGGLPASGPPWQATALAADDVQGGVDAAGQALGARIGDTASAVDGAAAQLAGNEIKSSDMVQSAGDLINSVTGPSADVTSALSGVVGDVSVAVTGAAADVTGALTGAAGDLSGAVSGPIGSLVGALDAETLAGLVQPGPGGLPTLPEVGVEPETGTANPDSGGAA